MAEIFSDALPEAQVGRSPASKTSVGVRSMVWLRGREEKGSALKASEEDMDRIPDLRTRCSVHNSLMIVDA